MTVEKKAKDLVNKFLRLSETCSCLEYNCICFTVYKDKAKKMSLISIKEIMETQDNVWENTIEYWNSVKKEVVKL